MSILTKDQILASVRERLKDDTSDESIKFIEDISDTIEDYETRTKDTTDWKQKYTDNDNEWRKKYRDRFFNTPSNEEKPVVSSDGSDDDNEPKKYTYDNLFKEETK